MLQATGTSILWQIAREPLADLVKNHFVPIFSISMAWHCSERSDSELGALVLQSSILHLAEISEIERDKLIKKHLVCTLYLNNDFCFILLMDLFILSSIYARYYLFLFLL